MPVPFFGWNVYTPWMIACAVGAFTCACIVSVLWHLIDSCTPEPPSGWLRARRRAVRLVVEALVIVGLVVGMVGLFIAL